jgi:hypothetical protein
MTVPGNVDGLPRVEASGHAPEFSEAKRASFARVMAECEEIVASYNAAPTEEDASWTVMPGPIQPNLGLMSFSVVYRNLAGRVPRVNQKCPVVRLNLIGASSIKIEFLPYPFGGRPGRCAFEIDSNGETFDSRGETRLRCTPRQIAELACSTFAGAGR